MVTFKLFKKSFVFIIFLLNQVKNLLVWFDDTIDEFEEFNKPIIVWRVLDNHDTIGAITSGNMVKNEPGVIIKRL